MLAIGGLLIITFVLVEWKFAKLPMMPSKSASPVYLNEKLTEGKSAFSKATNPQT